MDEEDYLDLFQSGFRPGFGTQMALIRVMGDLRREWDGSSVSILALLDLSAAFDTIDHGIFLGQLQELGCGSGWHHVVLAFLLLQGSFSVGVDRRGRDPDCGPYLVERLRAVLSPLLFSIYTALLGEVVCWTWVRYHQYADDTRHYLSTSGPWRDVVDVSIPVSGGYWVLNGAKQALTQS